MDIELRIARECLSDIGWSSEMIDNRIASWTTKAEEMGIPIDNLPKAMQQAFQIAFHQPQQP